MLYSLVVLRIIRQGLGTCVIRGEGGRFLGAEAKILEVSAKVDAFLGCLVKSYYFCFSGREGDSGLLLASP